jgi:hypothetical protein
LEITVDIKRVILTTAACFIVAAVSFYLSEQLNNSFVMPLAFALTIPLTNIDKVRIAKSKAFILSMILTIAVFFFATLAAFGLMWAIGFSSLYFTCALAGAAVFLINSIYTKIKSFKTGLIVTAILTLPVPILAQLLNQNFYGIEPSDGLIANPEVFYISWQTLVGLGISIGVWLQTK